MALPTTNINISNIRDAISDDTTSLHQLGRGDDYEHLQREYNDKINVFGFNSPDKVQLNQYWGRTIQEWPSHSSMGAWRNYDPAWCVVFINKVTIKDVGKTIKFDVTFRTKAGTTFPVGGITSKIWFWAEYQYMWYTYTTTPPSFVEHSRINQIKEATFTITQAGDTTLSFESEAIRDQGGSYTFTNQFRLWVAVAGDAVRDDNRVGDRRLWCPYLGAGMWYNNAPLQSIYRSINYNRVGGDFVPTYIGQWSGVYCSDDDNYDVTYIPDMVDQIQVSSVALRNYHNYDIPTTGATRAIMYCGQAGTPSQYMLQFVTSFDTNYTISGAPVILRSSWYEGRLNPLNDLFFDCSDWRTQVPEQYLPDWRTPVEFMIAFQYKKDKVWYDVEGGVWGEFVWQWFKNV